jgi:L-threonylcarbamoyladenylate synthase
MANQNQSAQILSSTPENIEAVARALKTGAVAGMPTETVYGLAGNALNPESLAKIFAAKERPTFDPLIVHVSEDALSGGLTSLHKLGLVDLQALSDLARERIETLIKTFWPGPLTLVLPKLPGVPDLATAGLPSVAIRMPKHPVAQALLKECGLPLAAPSANRFGRISPTQAQHVFDELGDRISYILDGGPCEIGVESTVLSMASDGTPSLLRPGQISRDEIEKLLKAPVGTGVSGEKQGAAIAKGQVAAPGPGMLESHYAPSKPLYLLSRSISALSQSSDALNEDLALKEAFSRNPKKIGILLMSGNPADLPTILSKWTQATFEVISLSPSGNLSEIAKNLFAGLRALDHSSAELLIAEPCESKEGLGHAISDRIKRASAKRA